MLFLQGLPHGHLSDDQLISQDGSNKNGYRQASFPEDSYTALSSLLIEFHRRPNYYEAYVTSLKSTAQTIDDYTKNPQGWYNK